MYDDLILVNVLLFEGSVLVDDSPIVVEIQLRVSIILLESLYKRVDIDGDVSFE